MMKALLYKQFRLVCHPMTGIFCLFGVMVLIPNYPYSVIFFYVTLGLFFSFMNLRERRDLYYCAILPVRKGDAVRAACLFTGIIELLSLVVMVPFAVLAVQLDPTKDNLVGMDPNPMLFAAGLLIYALFNGIFLTDFYKTGYKVGVAFVKAVIPMTVLLFLLEGIVHVPGLDWLDDVTAAAQLRQLPILLAALVIYLLGMLLTCREAMRRFEQVDL